MFLFVVNRADDAVKSKQKIYLYYIPFVFSTAVSVGFHLNDAAGFYEIPESYTYLIVILRLMQLVCAAMLIPFLPLYAYYLLRYLKDPKEKTWIITLLTMLYLVLFTWLATYLAGVFFDLDISATMSGLALIATLIMHWTAYMGIYKYKLAKNKEAIHQFINGDLAFSVPAPTIAHTSTQERSVAEAYKEPLTADNLYFQKLELLCKAQHIYTDSTLNREKVADKLGISPGYVSQIVNAVTGDNFANYINQYRVQAVQEMMCNAEYQNYNLLTMGLEAGFPSKTTFYKAFKKVTGQTPNEYKNTGK